MTIVKPEKDIAQIKIETTPNNFLRTISYPRVCVCCSVLNTGH